MSLCIEHKHLLDGQVKTYACDLVHFEPGFGILKYVIDREYDIHGHRLTPGDVTRALYWEDRPYTLYIWSLGSGTVLHYFNIADRISLSPTDFRWRDLVIDILIDNEGPHVLDAHELLQGLPPDLNAFIHRAQEQVLSNYRATIDESSRLLQRYL